MQDLTSAAAYYHQSIMMAAKQQNQPELPKEEQLLKCPRCDSPNTKFCYYNNYNLSQPRHYCKNCRRYWTKGGALRNIPVGGGSRKNAKRSGSSSSLSNLKNKTLTVSDQKPDYRSSESDSRDFASGSGSGSKLEECEKVTGNSGQKLEPTRMLYGLPVRDSVSGNFSSLLASNLQMGGIMYETGSRWYPGMGMGMSSGFRSDDAGSDQTTNRVENK